MAFTQREKEQLISTLENALKLAHELPVGKNCATCQHYDYSGRCKLAGAIPPPEVKKVGCESHLYDDDYIPF